MATIQASDVLPVRSRISWSAVLAGAFIALTAFLVLAALGFAVGVSVEPRVSGRSLAVASGIWLLLTMLISLFIGGCVCSRCTAGENKTEAVMGGIVVWGVVFFLLAWLTISGVNTGLRGVFNVAALTGDRSDQNLRNMGVPQDKIDEARAQLRKFTGQVSDLSDTDRHDRHKAAMAAAWWGLTGIILSLAASVVGAVVGAGPTLIITSMRLRGAAVTTEPVVRETVVR
jgi:hypothetical protein